MFGGLPVKPPETMVFIMQRLEWCILVTSKVEDSWDALSISSHNKKFFKDLFIGVNIIEQQVKLLFVMLASHTPATAMVGPGHIQEPATSFMHPAWVARVQELYSSFTAFSDAFTGSWVRSGASGTWEVLQLWCEYPRRQFNLPHHHSAGLFL